MATLPLDALVSQLSGFEHTMWAKGMRLQQIIYINLRSDFFGRLYRWNARDARMGQVLARLDDVMYDIVSKASPLSCEQLVHMTFVCT